MSKYVREGVNTGSRGAKNGDMTFLAPTMLLGLVCASIPVIIHLLNRRRFVRVDWAPMRYLKLTIKSNRRRLQLEQWLLLAIRTLALIILFLTLARPIASNSGFAAWLAGGSRKARVVVLDDSLSMLTRKGNTSAWERAITAAERIVRNTQVGDQLTVFTTTRPDSPLMRQAQVRDPAELIQAIRSIRPWHTVNQWASTFETVDFYLRQAAYPVQEIVLITDMRSTGWNREVRSCVDRWQVKDVACLLIDVGAVGEFNVSLDLLRQTSPVALVETPIEFEAQITNHSERIIEAQLIQMLVDGRSQSVDVPSIQPSETATVSVRVRPDRAGQHRIRLTLPRDELVEDNGRSLVMNVKPNIRIHLVDGDPRQQPFLSETDFLAASFLAGSAPWEVARLNDMSWSESEHEIPDVLVLANVPTVSEQQVRWLETHVAKGMGLIVFPGDLTDYQQYNQRLYRQGNGLLPVKLAEPLEQTIDGLIVQPSSNSPLEALAQVAPQALARVRPRQILRLEEDGTSKHRILARWNGQDRPPALVEKRFGNGQVYLWTVTADLGWSDWPKEPTYVLSMRETVKAVATQSSLANNLLVGEPLVTQFEAKKAPRQGKLTLPDERQPIELTVDTGVDPPEFRYEDTWITGTYLMQWSAADDQNARNLFAVNHDPRESLDQRLALDQLSELFGDLDWRVIRVGDTPNGAQGQSELWRTVAMCLLGVIGLESLLAAWIGRER